MMAGNGEAGVMVCTPLPAMLKLISTAACVFT
jgi:hypothetical protein